MAKVLIISDKKRFFGLGKTLKSIALRTLKILKMEKAGIEIYLIPDRQMRAINFEFRRQNKVSNVLSFPAPRDFPQHLFKRFVFLGEIYLAPDYVLEGKEDLSRLLIHGLLHLLGYNHKRKNDRIKMEKTENRLIGLLVH